jgi:alkylation response protein AidB-like acyl-CoA dehydrogenase
MTATDASTDTRSTSGTADRELVDELTAWLEENWDPDLTVADWWERLGVAGWSAPTLPAGSYGRGLSRGDAVIVQSTIAAHGALGAPGGLGLLLAAPTIATHGTPEQVEAFVRDIVTGKKAWCQLFSEPGAGSDLAGLQTKAIRDGDEYVVTGQKVWTSGGHYADLGMLIARTDPDVPKHQGITYFGIDMHQPGIDVRPLRELTGRALFNEVFLTEARVPGTAMIGGLNNGWAVANTTLAFERAGLGSGGGTSAVSAAIPGTVAGHLDKRAGDFVSGAPRAGGGGAGMRGSADLYVKLAQGAGRNGDPLIRQSLARLHTLSEIGRINNLRVKAAKAAGTDIAGMGNIAKLSMSEMVRLQRDVGLQIVGAAGTLHAYDADDRAALDAATGNPFLGVVTELALFAQAPPIYGGTDQVQRNILGERVLGLPKEPNNDRVLPFSELPKNV